MRQVIAASALILAACGSQSGNEQAAGGNKAAGESASAEGGSGGGGEAGATMEPGLWEMTIQVAGADIPTAPSGMTQAMPPTTARSCLTPEQVARPNAEFFNGGQAQGCNYENFSMAGGRIQGTVTCSMQGTTTRSTMDGQFRPTSFEMTQRAEVGAGGTNLTTQIRITGRRVGDCPAGG